MPRRLRLLPRQHLLPPSQLRQQLGSAIEQTIGLASPSEVGEWVELVAADELLRRAQKISRIEVASLDPVNAERFYKAYRRVEAKSFYLSEEQVNEVNALMEEHWERRTAEGGSIRIIEKPLTVNNGMNDEYLIN